MRYLVQVVASSIVVLAALAGLRFFGSHNFAPTDSGVHGLAVNSPVDVLFIGSSHTNRTYDARLLEARTGKKVFLVAYNGLGPINILPILKRVLTGPRPPKLVVVEAYGALWARPHAIQDPRLLFDADPELKAQLYQEFLAPQRSRTPRFDRFLDAFSLLVNRNNDVIVGYPLTRVLQRNVSYHGAYEDLFYDGLTERKFKALQVRGEGSADLDPQQLAAVRQIVRLARMTGTPIAFGESPLPGPIASQWVSRGLKANVKRVMLEERVPYFDGEEGFPLQDPAFFSDSNHLSTQGRTLLTENMAAWLKRTFWEKQNKW